MDDRLLTSIHLTMLILVVSGLGAALARWVRLPASTLIFVAGAAAGLWPGVPSVALDPAIVLDLFTPVLFYATAASASTSLLRWNRVAGVGIGLISTATAIAVCALLIVLTVPGVSLAVAIMFALIAVGPDDGLKDAGARRPLRALTDAVSVQHLVGAVMTILIFMTVSDMVRSGDPVPLVIVRRLAVDLGLGVPLGAAVAWVLVQLRTWTPAAPAEIGVSIATPFLVALLMSLLGGASAPAVVAAGLVVSAHHVDPLGRPLGSSEARMSAALFWRVAGALIGNVLFFVAGLMLPGVLEQARHDSGPVALMAFVIALVVLPVLATTVASIALRTPEIWPSYAGAKRPTRRRDALAVGWGATRSPIALVIAFSVPERLLGETGPAGHEAMLAFAGLLVAASLLIQATSIPWLLRLLGIGRAAEADAEAALARSAVTSAPTHEARRLALLRLRRANRIGDADLERYLLRVEQRAELADGA